MVKEQITLEQATALTETFLEVKSEADIVSSECWTKVLCEKRKRIYSYHILKKSYGPPTKSWRRSDAQTVWARKLKISFLLF